MCVCVCVCGLRVCVCVCVHSAGGCQSWWVGHLEGELGHGRVFNVRRRCRRCRRVEGRRIIGRNDFIRTLASDHLDHGVTIFAAVFACVRVRACE